MPPKSELPARRSRRSALFSLLFRLVFLGEDVTDEFTASGVADETLRLSSNHALPPILGGRDAAAGFEGFRLTYADNSGVEARGQPYTDADLINLVAGLERRGPEVHEVSLGGRRSGGAGIRPGARLEPLQRVLQENRPDAIGRPVHGQASSTWRQSGGAREWTRVLSGAQTPWSAVNS